MTVEEENIIDYGKKLPKIVRKSSNCKMIKFASNSYNNFMTRIDNKYKKEAKQLQEDYEKAHVELSKSFKEYEEGNLEAKVEFDRLFNELTKIGAKLVGIDTILKQRAEYKAGHKPKPIKLKDFNIRILRKKGKQFVKEIKKDLSEQSVAKDYYKGNMTSTQDKIFNAFDSGEVKMAENEVSRLADYNKYFSSNQNADMPEVKSGKQDSEEKTPINQDTDKQEKTMPTEEKKVDIEADSQYSKIPVGSILEGMTSPIFSKKADDEQVTTDPDEKTTIVSPSIFEGMSLPTLPEKVDNVSPVDETSNLDSNVENESIEESRKRLEELFKKIPVSIKNVDIPTFEPEQVTNEEDKIVDKDSLLDGITADFEKQRTDLDENAEKILRELNDDYNNIIREMNVKKEEDMKFDMSNYVPSNTNKDINENLDMPNYDISKIDTPLQKPIVDPSPEISKITIDKPFSDMSLIELEEVVKQAEQIKQEAEREILIFRSHQATLMHVSADEEENEKNFDEPFKLDSDEIVKKNDEPAKFNLDEIKEKNDEPAKFNLDEIKEKNDESVKLNSDKIEKETKVTDYNALSQLLNEGYTPDEIVEAAVNKDERVKFSYLMGRIAGEQVESGKKK